MLILPLMAMVVEFVERNGKKICQYNARYNFTLLYYRRAKFAIKKRSNERRRKYDSYTWLVDNKSTKWSEGLTFVQFVKNRRT